jgi:phosphoribosyl-ATP pyrophosphohydrolase/phosphoribosyl-AMP cyclohydrolase
MQIDNQDTVAELKFDEQGLIPAVIQDARTHRVLMMAYMNQEAVDLSLRYRETYFWSRSRQQIWHKGETSGNRQEIVKVELDCDSDTLLISVIPLGPVCHTGTESCFDAKPAIESSKSEPSHVRHDPQTILNRLVEVIKGRKADMPEGSYTAYLFSKGTDKILKKVGEETAETIIAAKNKSKPELTMESADLLYHLLVLFVNEGLELDDILNELERRAVKAVTTEE